jgi:hypothetical protein
MVGPPYILRMADPKPYVKVQPPTKDQLRAMLAQAVRNTQPELNPVTVPTPGPEPEAKRRGRPATRLPSKRPAKGKKART